MDSRLSLLRSGSKTQRPLKGIFPVLFPVSRALRILDKEPTTAEQYDRLGRNFLHLAINEKDTESVLFLIQVRVDVNSRTKDGEEATPLHLAVKIGDDFIVRNLTLAGAEVDAVDKTGQTALHCAAERDLAEITRILLQNGWKPDLLDEGNGY